MELLAAFTFFILLCIGLPCAPGYDQAKREREMLERMKALQGADEVAALLDVETREVHAEAEAMRTYRGARR